MLCIRTTLGAVWQVQCRRDSWCSYSLSSALSACGCLLASQVPGRQIPSKKYHHNLLATPSVSDVQYSVGLELRTSRFKQRSTINMRHLKSTEALLCKY